jgi:hypothetical protein
MLLFQLHPSSVPWVRWAKKRPAGRSNGRRIPTHGTQGEEEKAQAKEEGQRLGHASNPLLHPYDRKMYNRSWSRKDSACTLQPSTQLLHTHEGLSFF